MPTHLSQDPEAEPEGEELVLWEKHGLIIRGWGGRMPSQGIELIAGVAEALGVSPLAYLAHLAVMGASEAPIGQMIRRELADEMVEARILEMVKSLVDYAIENQYTRYGDGVGGGLVMDLEKELERRFPKPAPKPNQRKPIPAGLRTRVMERDEYRCVRCSAHEELCIDHVHPVSKGGTNDEDNIQVLCRPCNTEKGAKTMEEWLGDDWAEVIR